MDGGRGILMCISTAAIVGKGATITNARKIVPKSTFRIFYLLVQLKNDPLPHTFPKTYAIRFGHLAIFINLSTY
jgi:hypothetical protein